MNIQNKVVLITGAGGGIGKALTTVFSRNGARLALNCHSAENASKLKKEFPQAIIIPADISKFTQLKSLVEKTLEHYGRIDILINNAAIYPRLEFQDCDEESWTRIMDTNLKSIFFLSQHAAREMLKQKSGVIINISSEAGFNPKRNKGIVYHLSKSGVNFLTESLSFILAPEIKVNAIAPGRTDTPMALFYNKPELKKKVELEIPSGRVNTPEDIAKLALLIISKDFTGKIIRINGGAYSL